jgi:hypothetical protein
MVDWENGDFVTETDPTLYCAVHPGRETMLRCNRCDKPICHQCAVQTPVGFRCQECVRSQQAVYYNAERLDLPLAGVIALALGAVVGALAFAVLGGFGLFGFIAALFVGPFAGGLIAEAIRRAVKRRRSREMKWIAAGACIAGIALGGLFLLVGQEIAAGAPLGILLVALPALFFRLDVLLLAVLAASTIYARLQ